MLNVTEDHMDRYPGMEAYAAAKARIFAGNGVQVLNRDDALQPGDGAARAQGGRGSAWMRRKSEDWACWTTRASPGWRRATIG